MIRYFISICVLLAFNVISYAQDITQLLPITTRSVVCIKTKDKAAYYTHGTGFIVDERGYIITAYHVVKNHKAKKYFVTLNDKNEETYEAQVYKISSQNDLALLKITPKNKINALKIQTNYKIGEFIYLIGHPGGYLYSVSNGIISHTSRTVKTNSGVHIKNCIQTSAAINPGNSGGPMLNLRGEVVGMVNSMAKKEQNIGFAVNSHLISQFILKSLP